MIFFFFATLFTEIGHILYDRWLRFMKRTNQPKIGKGQYMTFLICKLIRLRRVGSVVFRIEVILVTWADAIIN